MKNGAVFKKDGVITVDKLLNPGPVNGFGDDDVELRPAAPRRPESRSAF